MGTEVNLWHYSLRLACDERSASRVLQVFDRQRVEPLHTRFTRLPGGLHASIQICSPARVVRRIGSLLHGLEGGQATVWTRLDGKDAGKPADEIVVSLRCTDLGQPDLNPESPFWQESPLLWVQCDAFGALQQGHETEVRLRWSEKNLYFLLVCHYRELSPRPGTPILDRATDRLWEHDVAEIFVTYAADKPESYLELEVSPRGEWLDLKVDHHHGRFAAEPTYSGFAGAACIYQEARRWVAFFRVPAGALERQQFTAGDRFGINFYRSQGNLPIEIAWRPTYDHSFHVPARFGVMYLGDFPC